MGKLIGSWSIRIHAHEGEDSETEVVGQTPTIEQVENTIEPVLRTLFGPGAKLSVEAERIDQ